VSRILGTYQNKLGDFFTLSRNPPITSLEIGANWVKNAHIPIFPPNDFEKRAEIIG